jgi:hypothetical protein
MDNAAVRLATCFRMIHLSPFDRFRDRFSGNIWWKGDWPMDRPAISGARCFLAIVGYGMACWPFL